MSVLAAGPEEPAAAQFAAHARLYGAVNTPAAAVHESFVKTWGISSWAYAAIEAANVAATD
jgi:PE family